MASAKTPRGGMNNVIILEFLAFLIIFPIAAYLIILGITCIIDFVHDHIKKD